MEQLSARKRPSSNKSREEEVFQDGYCRQSLCPYYSVQSNTSAVDYECAIFRFQSPAKGLIQTCIARRVALSQSCIVNFYLGLLLNNLCKVAYLEIF